MYSVPAWRPKDKYAEWYWKRIEEERAGGGAFSSRISRVRLFWIKKIAAIESVGVDAVAAGDASCLMQIGGGLSRRKSAVRVMRLAIARETKSQSVVKSKSMATEEIYFNSALEQAGLEAVETDLGEYIIQLAGETPSHIIVPAIHKNKRQIAELFHQKPGTPPEDDVAALTKTARARLRARFAQARIGISGINSGVAQTGTILILDLN